MNFLKVNINYIAMLHDFLNKYPHVSTMDYDQLSTEYYSQFYWPSNALETILESSYNWKCTSIIYPRTDDKKTSIFFKKWCEKYKLDINITQPEEQLLYQIMYHEPDIIYIHEIWLLPDEFIAKIKFLKPNIQIIGWNCAPASFHTLHNLKYVDRIYTCGKPVLNKLLDNGIISEYIPHMFDNRVLNKIDTKENKKYDVTFVGSLTKGSSEEGGYGDRIELLQFLIEKGIKVSIFGYTNDEVLKKYCNDAIFGIDMLRVFAQSKIVINQHILRDKSNSGNIRMFEATGVGSLLLTDYKEDLNDKFLIDKEVVTYDSYNEACEKILYYLEHDEQRELIAKRGQIRTLKDYHYGILAKSIHDNINSETNIKQRYEFLKKQSSTKNNDFKDKNNDFRKLMHIFINQLNSFDFRNKTIVLYGFGPIGEMIYKKHNKSIKMIVDQNFDVLKKERFQEISPPTILKDTILEFDYILISVIGQEDIISDFLLNCGISSDKILKFNL